MSQHEPWEESWGSNLASAWKVQNAPGHVVVFVNAATGYALRTENMDHLPRIGDRVQWGGGRMVVSAIIWDLDAVEVVVELEVDMK